MSQGHASALDHRHVLEEAARNSLVERHQMNTGISLVIEPPTKGWHLDRVLIHAP